MTSFIALGVVAVAGLVVARQLARPPQVATVAPLNPPVPAPPPENRALTPSGVVAPAGPLPAMAARAVAEGSAAPAARPTSSAGGPVRGAGTRPVGEPGARRRSPERALERRRTVVRGRTAHVRWHERLRSGIALTALVMALGAGFAALTAGGVLMAYLLLQRAVG